MSHNLLSKVAVAVISIVAVLFAYATLFPKRTPPPSGSVSITNEYMATSTAADGTYGAFTTGRLIRTGSGSLGSVIITGANTGVVNFYDATTTDVTQRTGQVATTTILIASLPASLAAGTYVLDAQYSHGLYMDLVSGSMPTSSVTYR